MQQLLFDSTFKTMSVRIPESLYQALKKHAQGRDISMNRVIAELIAQNLAK